MFLIVQILAWTLVGVLALIVLALVMPLRLEMEVSRQDALAFSATLRPFGRFGPRIALSRTRKKPEVTPKARRKKRRVRGFGKLQPKQLASAGLRLVVELAGKVRIEAATLDLRFGLGDPADTGAIYGQVTPLIYGLAGMRRVRVDVAPVFDRAALTGRAALDLSLVPVRIVPPFVRFGWTAFGPGR